MQKTKVVFDITKAKEGMDIVHKAVSSTIGAAGRNVGYRQFGRPIASNDGVSIARMIELEDEEMAFGADFIKDCAEKTNEEVGDGTSTVTVLAHAMVEKGMEKIASGVNPMRLKREIQDAVTKVTGELNPTPINTDEELFNIANISMENPEIAQIVTDAVKKAGENGSVIVEESMGMKVEKDEIEGYSFDKGYISPVMMTNPETGEAVLENVPVLITDKNLNMFKDISSLTDFLMGKKINRLLIIAENVQGELLQTILFNRMKGNFHAVVVQKPFNKDMLEDIAIYTGGKVLRSEEGITDINESHHSALGFAKNIKVTKDECIIIGGGAVKETLDERVTLLKTEIESAESYDKGVLKDRLARICGSVVILNVGAPTENEAKYLKLKIDDAVAATKAAMKEGVVKGGGVTLYNLSLAKSETEGEEVVRYACGMPIRKIIENAGFVPEAILSEVKDGKVFNALTGTIENNDKIIDPAMVERCALINAGSVAQQFLTMNSLIVDIQKKNMV